MQTNAAKKARRFLAGHCVPNDGKELELDAHGDLIPARVVERFRKRCSHAPVGANERRVGREQRLENRVRNRVWDRYLFHRLVVREAQRTDAGLEVVSLLIVRQVEDIQFQLQVQSAGNRDVLRVVEIEVVVTGRPPGSRGLGVAVGVARGAGQRTIGQYAFQLVRLPGLNDGEGAHSAAQRQEIGARQLEDVAAVAAQVAVLEVPELASRSVTNVR